MLVLAAAAVADDVDDIIKIVVMTDCFMLHTKGLELTPRSHVFFFVLFNKDDDGNASSQTRIIIIMLL